MLTLLIYFCLAFFEKVVNQRWSNELRERAAKSRGVRSLTSIIPWSITYLLHYFTLHW